MTLDESWFSEACEECGSAFSLKIKAKLHEEQTPYQKIEVYETETFGNLLTIDGLVMLTTRDNFIYHEMMAHPALFTHERPETVLIVGGGDCGTLREVLRHPGVREAWQVEIDERVTRVAEHFFPDLCESNTDPRARFRFTDAIQWVKAAASESLDVIIVDSTDPIGPAEGLFSEPFYRECFRALKHGGVLVQQSESPFFHMHIIKDMHSALHSAGFEDSQPLHFFQCSYPSGWWSAAIAGKGRNVTRFRKTDAENRPFETRYYNTSIHSAALAAPEYVHQALRRAVEKPDAG